MEDNTLICMINAGPGSVRALVWHMTEERSLYGGTGTGTIFSCTFLQYGKNAYFKVQVFDFHVTHLAINMHGTRLYVATGRAIGFVEINNIGFGPLKCIYTGPEIEDEENLDDLTTITSMNLYGSVLIVGFFGSAGVWFLDVKKAIHTGALQPFTRMSVYGGSAINSAGKVMAFHDLTGRVDFFDLERDIWLEDSSGGPANIARLVNLVFVNDMVVMCGSDRGVITFWKIGKVTPLASVQVGTPTSLVTGLAHGVAVVQEGDTNTIISIRLQDILEHVERMQTGEPSNHLAASRAHTSSPGGGSQHNNQNTSPFNQATPRKVPKLDTLYGRSLSGLQTRTSAQTSITARATRILQQTMNAPVSSTQPRVSFGDATSIVEGRPLIPRGHDTPSTPFIPDAHSSPVPADPFSAPQTTPPTSSRLFHPGPIDYRSPFKIMESPTPPHSPSTVSPQDSPLVARLQAQQRAMPAIIPFRPAEHVDDRGKTPKAPGHYNRTLTEDAAPVPAVKDEDDLEPQMETGLLQEDEKETSANLGPLELGPKGSKKRWDAPQEVARMKLSILRLAMGGVICAWIGVAGVYMTQLYFPSMRVRVVETSTDERPNQRVQPISQQDNTRLLEGPCRASIVLTGECPVDSPLVFDLGTRLSQAFHSNPAAFTGSSTQVQHKPDEKISRPETEVAALNSVNDFPTAASVDSSSSAVKI
ncbi:hypothetical protein BJ165DRAFT_1533488 [Panaeolus papilionaceus]|nr:hypothetical protein BJ165DRAFT_1533488 [Panaeolus papilionaceus]